MTKNMKKFFFLKNKNLLEGKEHVGKVFRHRDEKEEGCILAREIFLTKVHNTTFLV
jgi:hypothetical protein